MDAINKSSPLGNIQVTTGSQAGKAYQIQKGVVTIGRDPANDIVINDPTVSRRHARLQRNYDLQWVVEKITSNNSLSVNQRDVQQQVEIKDGDILGLGPSTKLLLSLKMPEQRVAPPTPPLEEIRTLRADPNPTPGIRNRPAIPDQPTFAVSLPRRDEPAAHLGTQIAAPFQPGASGVPSLEISTNTRPEKQIFQLTKSIINIGRDAANDIVINDPTVSGQHAQIVREEDQLVLIHPHPSRQRTVNGLMYQGRQIAGDQRFRQELRRGDVFRIGDVHGSLVTLTYNDGTGSTQDILPEIHPIPLDADVLTIGRAQENNVVLSHPQVSAYHARMVRTKDTYRIVDMGSTNHVYVNALRIKDQVLKPGDEIRIGPFKLTFTGTTLTQQDESDGIRIDALGLKKSGGRKVVILNDISIAIPSRKFVALVGGSGAGKSTLMDALNGLRPAQEGVVLYNGQDYYRNLAAFSTQLGYVPQDDIIHRDLTVERALYYAAKMRLPEDFTSAQIKQRVNEVLDDVEMKHRRKLLVSKLSGGQRKRVSIALELLANPSVFFLDEPTSGLDPGLDRKMMLLLRRLADKGHTIVLVTHATNNINVCDYICFLTQGGRVAYYGPPNEGKTYFGKSSFAEIYTALEPTEENPNIPAEAEARFQASEDYQRYVVAPLRQRNAAWNGSQRTEAVKPPKRGKPFKQFGLLSMRYLELLKNDVGNLLILLLQAPVIALILMFIANADTFEPDKITVCPHRNPIFSNQGPIVSNDCQEVLDFLTNDPQGQAFVTQQNKTPIEVLQDFIQPGFGATAQMILFIMSFAAVMFGCINAAREIVKEGPIYRRERAVNLGIIPYMFSKIVVLGILCLLQSAILVILVNFRIPFVESVFLPPLLEIYISVALTSLAGLMLGLAVSSVAPNNDRAMSFVPIILIPQVIFSGIIFELDGPPLQILGGLFAARWSIAGLGSSVGLHGDKLGVDDFAYCGTLFSTCTQQEATMHMFIVWGALVAMILVLGGVVAFFLKRKDVRV